MPAKGSKDTSKYKSKRHETDENGTEKLNKTLRSQLDASAAYDANNVDNIRLRVPKGMKEQIQNYVQASDDYPSVNAMIIELIKKELGIK